MTVVYTVYVHCTWQEFFVGMLQLAVARI